MKCAIKSCQRSKVLSNGFCNACSDAKNLNKPKEVAKNVMEVNEKEMEGIYRKLKKGDIVNQNVVNTINVGGLMSFLAQKEVNQNL